MYSTAILELHEGKVHNMVAKFHTGNLEIGSEGRPFLFMCLLPMPGPLEGLKNRGRGASGNEVGIIIP